MHDAGSPDSGRPEAGSQEAGSTDPLRPRLVHTYQSALLDSTRWNDYVPRDDDVIVATPYKSGTTWTLNIVRRLIFQGTGVPAYRELWLDATFGGELHELLEEIEGLRHRRYLKTHLALDGLPYFTQVKYIVVGRDVRDVFMSYVNHYRSMTPEFRAAVNDRPDRAGPPLPPFVDDIHHLWRDWITRGTFPWEQEGYPWWGNMHHVRTWWDFRHLENILFVHFADLLADLTGQIRRIAAFLDIAVDEEALPAMVDRLSLGAMRAEAAERHGRPDRAEQFYFKGTNGRWRGVLSPEEQALYDDTAARVLTPECRAWLERGLPALP